MATYAAIAATSQVIVGLLETAAKGDPEFGTVSFSICASVDRQAPLTDRRAVTLCLYHVGVDASLRNAPGRMDAPGVRLPPVLPLDLHYLLIAWSKDAATQQRLLGWACRVIADTATLPAGVLNASSPQLVFRTSEARSKSSRQSSPRRGPSCRRPISSTGRCRHDRAGASDPGCPVQGSVLRSTTATLRKNTHVECDGA